MDSATQSQLIEYLRDFTTESRWETIQEVLSNRTNYITVVLEDLHKPHNANAVLRSCDGFGIQDVHIIENRNAFDAASTVSIGAHQWLTLSKYNQPGEENISSCFDSLREKGYKVFATTPHEQDQNLNELPINQKTALVFGTEREGLSNTAMEQADGYVKIPMSGFSESFNISVSAAVCLYDLTTRLRNSDLNWQLDEEYQRELSLLWLKKTIKASDKLVEKFLTDRTN
ncbi:MAG: RNA methyltransferase [Balneolaceae bacterium]|nr:RNA methyltransferase [Balneolaceae bacterium]MBO6546311.1 RNA methyltransferase [Balneolaceae bacterium]MBO6648670.1 RNA methyltransferase [Balneolaceae bacterium]